MICDVTREDLIGYLYNDLEMGEREKLGAHIAGCPACKKIIDDLASTSRMLQAWPNETPNLHMVFVEDRQSFIPAVVRRHPWRWAIGVAATLAAVLVLSFLNVEFAYQNGTFHASLGLRGKQSTELVAQVDQDQPVTFGELISAHQQVLTITQQMIEASEHRQKAEVNTAFGHLVRDLMTQRQEDLQDVQKGLQAIYNVSQQRDDFVRDLIQQRQEDLKSLRRDMQVIYKVNQKSNLPAGTQLPFMFQEHDDSSATRVVPVGSP